MYNVYWMCAEYDRRAPNSIRCWLSRRQRDLLSIFKGNMAKRRSLQTIGTRNRIRGNSDERDVTIFYSQFVISCFRHLTLIAGMSASYNLREQSSIGGPITLHIIMLLDIIILSPYFINVRSYSCCDQMFNISANRFYRQRFRLVRKSTARIYYARPFKVIHPISESYTQRLVFPDTARFR